MNDTAKVDWQKRYEAPNRLVWRGRSDGPGSIRYHEVVRCLDLREGFEAPKTGINFGMIGFASDEGIRRNQGRIGASGGPVACKQAFANVPIPVDKEVTLFDFGNIICNDGDLEASQEALGQAVSLLLRKGLRPILLGGGHEISWGHYQGIYQNYSGDKLGIINFDAHYDLRSTVKDNKSTSGSPFLQIAEARKAKNQPFSYTVFGIQSLSNTPVLFERAKNLGVKTVFAEKFFLGKVEEIHETLRQDIENHEELYVSLCMDVFSHAFAPGVSATQSLGLHPWHIVPMIRMLAASGKVLSFDIGEISPPLDRDGMTAELAAALIGNFINFSAS